MPGLPATFPGCGPSAWGAVGSIPVRTSASSVSGTRAGRPWNETCPSYGTAGMRSRIRGKASPPTAGCSSSDGLAAPSVFARGPVFARTRDRTPDSGYRAQERRARGIAGSASERDSPRRRSGRARRPADGAYRIPCRGALRCSQKHGSHDNAAQIFLCDLASRASLPSMQGGRYSVFARSGLSFDPSFSRRFFHFPVDTSSEIRYKL